MRLFISQEAVFVIKLVELMKVDGIIPHELRDWCGWKV
jgi:hypothetical protein